MKKTFWLCLILFLSITSILPTFAQALTFSGRVDHDFPANTCFDDPGQRSVGVPATFPEGTISGFDIQKICLLYDQPSDTLFVGLKTFDDTLGNPIIFGDADGDGGPSRTSSFLQDRGGQDYPDLAQVEYFSFIVDFDADFLTPPDVVAGVSAERSLSGFRVAEVALPHLGFDFSFLDTYYGDVLDVSRGSEIFSNPQHETPHLEFFLKNFSRYPGFPSVSNRPNTTIGFLVKAGSLGDDGIGDEDIRVRYETQNFFDDDGDQVPNDSDHDSDNDGIPDVTEQDLDNFDHDHDCDLSDSESQEASMTHSSNPDTDQDGISDYLDTDADGDSIADIDESDSIAFDVNHDRVISESELQSQSCRHTEDLPDTDDDGIPDYRDAESDGDSIIDSTEAGDTDLLTPPLDTDHDGLPNYRDTDSDNDGLSDQRENDLGTDVLNPDTDGDGNSDGEEVAQNHDPLYPGIGIDPDVDIPNSADTVQLQGSGPISCSLNQESQNASEEPLKLFVVLLNSVWVLALLFIFVRKRNRLFVLFIFVFSLLTSNAWALNLDHFSPPVDSVGLVNLSRPRTLEARAWSLGLALSYAQNPLELGSVSSGARLDSLIDYQVGMILNGAYGIKDWVSVGISLPFSPAMRLEDLGSSKQNTTASFGDIGFEAKMKLWNWENENLHMGVAILPSITFPTGELDKYTRSHSVTGSVKGAYELDIGKNVIVANLGFRFREKESLLNLSVGQELLYGVGYTRPIVEDWDFHGLTELSGSTTLNGFGSRSNRSPLEWFFGLRKGFKNRFQATVGSSWGMTNGYGVPDFRVFGMVSYEAPPIPKPERPKVIEKIVEKKITYHTYARVEGGEIVILQPIHFANAKWVILPESLPVVKSVADLMANEPYLRLVLIEGHTDHRGSNESNLKLSEKRATAVREKLIEYGVEPERLISKGRGEYQPISDQSEAGMAKNRRVEFHIIKVQKLEEKEEVTEKKVEVIKH